MIIIGCDYHPGVQQISFVDTDTGEFQETRLQHREPAEQFYRELALRGMQVRLGMEASGQARWFERLLAELQMELWIGDAASTRSSTLLDVAQAVGLSAVEKVRSARGPARNE